MVICLPFLCANAFKFNYKMEEIGQLFFVKLGIIMNIYFACFINKIFTLTTNKATTSQAQALYILKAFKGVNYLFLK